MTVSQIIKSLGGATVLADGIGLPGEGIGALRVRAWSQRGAIPGAYWAAISAFSKEAGHGVTLEVLAAAHAANLTEQAAA